MLMVLMIMIVVMSIFLCRIGRRSGSGFADFLKGLLQGRDIGLSSIIGDRDGLILDGADDVLHTFLKGDILHHFIYARIAVQIDVEDDRLFVGLGLHHYRATKCQKQ